MSNNQQQNKYIDPVTEKPINVKEVIKNQKLENKEELEKMIQDLQQQNSIKQKQVLKNRNITLKKRVKELDQKIRSQRSNQFTRHTKHFEGRSTENLYFQKPIGLPPSGYEKTVINKKSQNENERYTEYEQTNQKSQFLSTNNANNMTNNSSSFFNHYTTKEGGYFDQYGIYKKYPLQQSKSLSNLSMNVSKQQSITGFNSKNSITQKTQQAYDNNTSINNKMGSSLVSSANQTMVNNSLFQQNANNLIWKQHYGVTQQKPFFNNITVDSINLRKKPLKLNKKVSEKEFYPSNTYQQKRLFQEYPYSLPQVEKQIILDDKFNIEMGF